MAQVSKANSGSIYLPFLFSKIEGLPAQMQEDVLLFTDFLLNKSTAQLRDAKTSYFDETADDSHFAGLSLSSLSKEWNSAEDEEWDTILAQMPSIG
jgi:hypothetical protein